MAVVLPFLSDGSSSEEGVRLFCCSEEVGALSAAYSPTVSLASTDVEGRGTMFDGSDI